MLIAFIVAVVSLAADPDGDGEAHPAAVAAWKALAKLPLPTDQRVLFHEAGSPPCCDRILRCSSKYPARTTPGRWREPTVDAVGEHDPVPEPTIVPASSLSAGNRGEHTFA